MKLIMAFAVIILVGIIAIICISKGFESIANCFIMKNKGNRFDKTKKKNGIVYNSKTGKLEADQSMILPF